MASKQMDWQKTLLVAGVTAGALAAAVYFLSKEESVGTSDAKSKDKKKQPKGELSKDDFIELIKEVISATAQMKVNAKEITEKYKTQSAVVDFEQIYAAVNEVSPREDPLERKGLSPGEFESYLVKYEREPTVKPVLEQFFDRPNPNEAGASKIKDVSVGKIFDVHKLMLQETEALTEHVKALPSKASYNAQTCVIAAQIWTALKVERAFGLTTEDVDAAVMQYHVTLANDQEFVVINNKIQQNLGTMTASLGSC